MQDSTLLKISLIASMVGLLSLFFALKNAELPALDGASLQSGEGKYVKVVGIVASFSESEKFATLQIRESKYGSVVDVTLFKSENKAINLSIGSAVEARGQMRSYRGRTSMIADSVRG